MPDPDLQIGVLLALLQDDAKNQSSYLTWGEGAAQPEVAAALRERFSGVAGARRQTLRRLGTAPAASAACTCRRIAPGTERVAALRRRYPPEKILPALYGCPGLVDIVTVEAGL